MTSRAIPPGAAEICDRRQRLRWDRRREIGSTGTAMRTAMDSGMRRSLPPAVNSPPAMSPMTQTAMTRRARRVSAQASVMGSTRLPDGTIDNDRTAPLRPPTDSCLDILTADPAATDGAWWVDSMGGDVAEAWCEMDVEGRLDGRLQLHGSASSTWRCRGLPRGHHRQRRPSRSVCPTRRARPSRRPMSTCRRRNLYGWAPSDEDDVSRYATYTRAGTGRNFRRQVLRCERHHRHDDRGSDGLGPGLQTNNSPSTPTSGWDGRSIIPGATTGTTPAWQLGQLYDTKSCCTSGNTSDMLTSGWRYTVYIGRPMVRGRGAAGSTGSGAHSRTGVTRRLPGAGPRAGRRTHRGRRHRRRPHLQ